MSLNQTTRNRKSKTHAGFVGDPGVGHLEEVSKDLLMVFGRNPLARVSHRYANSIG